MKVTDVAGFVTDDSPTKMHKKVAIAKSGIYQYHISELGGLFDGNIQIPEQHKSRTIFNVYRPAEVLRDAKSLFIQLPLTREHPEDFVTPENIRDEKTGWIGWTGDSSHVEILEDQGEVTINSTLNIVEKTGLRAYDHGIKEVSPGYIADFVWKDGLDKNNTQYQIVMTKINEVNHLALVDMGRGGKDASILDHKKEFNMDDKETKNLFQKFMSMFDKPKKILDSIPKDIEKFTDEQKDYLLKEMHRMLQHRVSGKTFDSFFPIGFTKDDMGEDVAQDGGDQTSTASQESETSKGDIAGGDGGDIKPKEDKDKVTEKEDGAADSEEEAHKKIAEGLKEDIKADEKEDGQAEDAPATQSAIPGQDTVEPTQVHSTMSEASTQPQSTVRAKDGAPISMKVGDGGKVVDTKDPFSIMDSIRNGFGSNSQAKKETK